MVINGDLDGYNFSYLIIKIDQREGIDHFLLFFDLFRLYIVNYYNWESLKERTVNRIFIVCGIINYDMVGTNSLCGRDIP